MLGCFLITEKHNPSSQTISTQILQLLMIIQTSYLHLMGFINPIVDPTPEVSDHAPAQRWTRDHPIDQILGDPDSGIQTRRSSVWNLVPRPSDKTVIGTKWVFRNKLDEHGTVTRNKARLVAQGYRQEEGID
ncbi:hypothetical protein L6452_06451 [Arctium lappa]|uniref:Uncharacterized protein n=1 Tax=Arctium lappa TaxID=4217 RepID=A0ACB9EIY0_ARCLA|nr:hypothetical protein L6452_06451 [Arctium lappa]